MSEELQIGEWLVESDLNRITGNGRTIAVEPKVLEVLLCLADHPGEVLSKDEIVRLVWPGTFVSAGTLSYSISELRRAFGDDAHNPRVIQTISRKGYRLIAPVSGRRKHSEAPPSVAVLAFSDMSPSKDQEFFCDGIAEEIISSLAHVDGLRVAARMSSFAFKGKNEDVRTIGKRLGVTTVLEGSVRKAGDRLRITAQLINAEDGCHLWSERYDRQLEDIFEVQDEISRSIAAALRITLSPEEQNALGRIPTLSLEAYEYYLRGKRFFYQYNRKGIEFALLLFSRAIEADPEFALAHAGISDCAAFLYLYAGSRDRDRDRADAASLKAIDLDPESAEAHATRGVALSLMGRYAEAELSFDTAIRLGPRLFEAYYFYARTAFVQGKLDEALALYEQASAVHPHDYQSPLLVAQIYADLGRMEEAEVARRRGIQLAETRLRLNPDDARALYMGANGLVGIGETDQGLEWARLALEIDPDDPMLLYNVACIRSLAGKTEEALDSLERSVMKGLTERRWLERDSNLEALRSLPRYHALLARLVDRESVEPLDADERG